MQYNATFHSTMNAVFLLIKMYNIYQICVANICCCFFVVVFSLFIGTACDADPIVPKNLYSRNNQKISVHPANLIELLYTGLKRGLAWVIILKKNDKDCPGGSGRDNENLYNLGVVLSFAAIHCMS